MLQVRVWNGHVSIFSESHKLTNRGWKRHIFDRGFDRVLLGPPTGKQIIAR